MVKKNILVVIPARGGSKGIPQKNLRLLNGKPLISYVIKTALSIQEIDNVIVSSDNESILSIAEKYGADSLKREEDLSSDKITLDPVIQDALLKSEKFFNKEFDIIITLQPTSPLLKSTSIIKALSMFNDSSIDSVLSVVNDTHLTWIQENGRYKPNYLKRVNRQELPKIFKETGGIIACTRETLVKGSRIGNEVCLVELDKEESIDIDNYEDWNICDFYIKRKKILFVLLGNSKLGLGHVYNCLTIANRILNHEIEFLVEKDSQLAYDKIKSYNYPVFIQEEVNICDDIKKRKPDVIINDLLDTSEDYIKKLKKDFKLVINFEDLGQGAQYADLVINAMYPEENVINNHYFGQNYFCINDLFLQTKKVSVKDVVKKVLISFGGVDPLNLTKKVLNSIYDYCVKMNIEIIVIAGMGYNKFDTIKEFKKVVLLKNIKNIYDYMSVSDVAFISSGRTSFEVACLGLPSIVISQNERETTHFFAKNEFGFIYLGHGIEIENSVILKEFKKLKKNINYRQNKHLRLLDNKIENGTTNVVDLINKKIKEIENL